MKCLLVFLFLVMPVIAYSQDKNTKIKMIKERVSKFKISDIKETTAVAGVRGADDDKGDDLYWAGKESVRKEELESFKIIIDKYEQGNVVETQKDIEIFLIKYPNSALAKEAWELLNILKSQ